MEQQRIRVIVPATTANMGPGFDTLGMALGLYNIVELESTTDGRITVSVEGEGAGELPCDESNLVCRLPPGSGSKWIFP